MRSPTYCQARKASLVRILAFQKGMVLPLWASIARLDRELLAGALVALARLEEADAIAQRLTGLCFAHGYLQVAPAGGLVLRGPG